MKDINIIDENYMKLNEEEEMLIKQIKELGGEEFLLENNSDFKNLD